MTANRTVSFPLFLHLPKDVQGEILRHFSPKELCFFAQKSKTGERETAFLRLLTSAVDAEPESYKQEDETRLAAVAILKRHLKRDPELLFREGMVTDHFGREIKASPYRLLLGVGDKWALKQVHDTIIPNIEDGVAKAQVQFKLQFPNCPWPFDPKMGEEVFYDDRNKKQIADVITQLQTIVRQIIADPCTDGQATLAETTQAVEELRQIFTPKEGDVIQTGLHFPLGIMQEIYKQYCMNPFTPAQLTFFSLAVIGSAEAALTAVDGQCCKNGLNKLNMEKGPDRRDGLFCRRPQGIPPKLAPIVAKLGRSMFVIPYDGESCFLSSERGYFDWLIMGRRGPRARVRLAPFGGRCGVAGRLENLWRTKAETIGSYYAATRREVNTSSRRP